jgi:MOSC domain-containing protein YiiM
MFMSNADSKSRGQVASLHLHPEKSGTPMAPISEMEVEASRGIVGEPRYFGRTSRSTGEPSRRQVTLMEREQIQEHATALGMSEIAPGLVRSNVETTGVDLISLIGKDVKVGGAILRFYAPRDPCEQMDAICQGLRERMLHSRQGVLAEVIESGAIKVGDVVEPVE